MQVKEVQNVEGHTEHIWNIAWKKRYPQGNMLASCSADKLISLWSIQTIKVAEENELQINLTKTQILDAVHTKTVRSLSFSHNGKFLASASFDSTIGIWILNDGKFKHLQTLEGHENEVKCVAWSWDDKYLASCSRDKTIWIWDYDQDLEFQCNSVLQGHTQDIKFLKWIPQTYDFLSCGYDDTIRLWVQDVEEWDCPEKNILTEHESTVWSLDIKDEQMVSVSDDQTIRIWKMNKQIVEGEKPFKITQTIANVHTEPIYSCSFSGDGKLLATGSGDNTICVFIQGDDHKFELLTKIQTPTQDVNCVSFNQQLINPYILATCGDDEIIRIIKVYQ